jgi:DUF917 family protein
VGQNAAVRIDESNLARLARGCSVLGAGGGGDTYASELACLHAFDRHGPVEVVDLDDLPDDGLVMSCGGIGAPTVSIEKLGCEHEGEWLRQALEEVTGGTVAAVMAAEIGGGNGVLPVAWAARIGLPVVDADGMGRAFPEVQQVTMEIAGIDPSPCVMTDERGNRVVIRAADGHWLERLARAAAVEFGGSASSAEYTMTAVQARTATVRGSVSHAVRIGGALDSPDDPIAALREAIGAAPLIRGKLTDVDRRVAGGFVRGSAAVEGLDGDRGRTVTLEIQNENLVALEDGDPLAMVPDIITVLDAETGHAVHTERPRYGQRVVVIAFPCDPIWRSPDGLRIAGPRAFGYDLEYVPVERLAG